MSVSWQIFTSTIYKPTVFIMYLVRAMLINTGRQNALEGPFSLIVWEKPHVAWGTEVGSLIFGAPLDLRA